MRLMSVVCVAIILSSVSVNAFASGSDERAERSQGVVPAQVRPAISGSIAVDKSIASNPTAVYDQYRMEIIPLKDAIDAAKSGATNAGIIGIQLEVDDGFLVYRAQFSDGGVEFLDAGNGAVLAENPPALGSSHLADAGEGPRISDGDSEGADRDGDNEANE